MSRLFLQLTVLSACTAIFASGTLVSLLRVPPPEITQHKDSPLSVECQAASTNPNLEIQWYRLTGDGQKFQVNSAFWASQGLVFMTKNVPRHSRILTFVTSTLTIKQLSADYAGTYACRAVAEEVKVDADAFQVHVSGTNATSDTSPVTGGCLPPNIADFDVSPWPQSSEEAGIHSLLTWNPVNHAMNACVVNHWNVRYASWPSNLGLPESDFTVPHHAIWSHPIKLPAIQNSANVTILNSSNYHIFQLSADFKTQPVNKLVINSHIFYFQDQAPAKVVSPPVTIRAQLGSNVLLSCNVIGIPLPSVTWLKEVGQEDPLAPPTDSNTDKDSFDDSEATLFSITLRNVGLKDTGVYKCMAQNRLVNPPKGMWESTDWGTITLIIE